MAAELCHFEVSVNYLNPLTEACRRDVQKVRPFLLSSLGKTRIRDGHSLDLAVSASARVLFHPVLGGWLGRDIEGYVELGRMDDFMAEGVERFKHFKVNDTFADRRKNR